MPSRSEQLSQVFLKDRDLVVSLVERSSINLSDIVVEIGPGKGIITNELVKRAGKVVAVEKDQILHRKLLTKFTDNPRVELYNADILHFSLPETPYKVFSNIPFALESKIIRMLIDHPHNPPLDAYLIMRREVARRLAGQPREGQFSILHQPWFELEIFYDFERGDFQPKPKTESSMIRFKKREYSLINSEDKGLYELFIKQGFGGGGRLKQNLSSVFSSNRLKRLAQELGFREKDMPSQLDFEQWLGMFRSLNPKLTSTTGRQP